MIGHRAVVRSAWLAWSLFIVAIGTVIVWEPTGRSVTPNYHRACRNWCEGLPIYEEGPHGFLYFPQAAALFAPFAYLRPPYGDVAWRAVSILALAAAAWRLGLLLGQRRKPAVFWLITLTAIPPALASARNGQMNLVLISLATLAFVALAARQRRAAAVWLCLGVALKPLMAVPLVVAAAVDRRVIPALALGLLIVATAPFLVHDPQYVWLQYRACLCKLSLAGDPGAANPHADLFGMLASLGFTAPLYAQTAVRLSAAVLLICLCRAARGQMSAGRLGLYWLTLTAGCLALINPRMENNGYVLLAPSLGGLAALAWTRRDRRPITGLFVAIATLSIAGSFELTRGPNFWLCPLVTCAVLANVVVTFSLAGRRAATKPLLHDRVCVAGLPAVCDHDLTVIIPAYNEGDRLPRTLTALKSCLETWGIDYRVLVVDDGSHDGTALVCDGFGGRFRTLRLPMQRGKGAAVRAGMRAATGRVVAFTDADLPYELAALCRGYEWIESGRGEVVFGARDIAGSTTRVPRRPARAAASLLFRAVTKRLISRGVTDTQCGLKLFSGRAARAIFSRTIVDGFAFDAEVVWLCHELGLDWRRVPVTLVHDYGSSLSIRRHAWRMLWDVLRLRRRRRAHRRDVVEMRNQPPAPVPAYLDEAA